jgi:ataxia telangiectasia mutated family protein
MVDGFGISKTEGVFRRCAEQTFRVLRENSEIISTVLDVFKYDPLHSWTINPVKKLRLQEEQQQKVPITPISETGTIISLAGGATGAGIGLESDPVDESRERALGAVSRKLDKQLSIEYTVNELIVAATDVHNLACLWHGNF